MARIKKIATELQVKDKLLDYSGDAGTSGQLLSSTGTGTNWITFSGVTASNGSSGRAAFFTGSTTIEGSDNFYWDNSNARLGIGTSSPAVTLHVSGFARANALQLTNANAQIYNISNSSLRLGTNNTERMRIDASGNVGIGTTSPDRKFEVESTGTGEMCITGTTGSRLYFRPTSAYSAGGNFGIIVAGTSSSPYLSTMDFTGYHNGVNTIMTMKGDGKVGINNTSPGVPLDVFGANGIRATVNSSALADGYFAQLHSDYGANALRLTSRKGDVFRASNYGQDVSILTGNPTSERIRVTSAGDVGIGTTSPSSPLHVYDTTSDRIAVFESGDNKAYIQISDNDTTGYVSSENGLFSLGRNAGVNANNININASHNVGIGTSSPSDKLEIDGGSGNVFIQLTTPNANYAGIKFGDPESAIAGRIQYYHGDNSMQFDAQGKFLFQGGNVGIGTDNPARNLHIHENDSTLSYIQITNDTTGAGGSDGVSFGITSDEVAVWTNRENTDTTISTNNTERMRITSAGNVGIGTSSPSDKLEINGNIKFGDSHFIGDDSFDNLHILASSGENVVIQAPSGNSIDLKTAGGSTLNLDSSQNATFAGDVTVSGNLTVDGTTTTINTATVEVEDNILQLNTTQGSPDTATATTSGISVYRGNGVTQASLIFDDADDTWDLTNSLAVASNVTASGNVIADKIGINKSSPTGRLHINQTVDNQGIIIESGSVQPEIEFRDTATGDSFSIGHNRANSQLAIEVDGTDKYVFTDGGRFGINTTSPSSTLSVISDQNSVARFVTSVDRATIQITDEDTTAYIGVQNNVIGIGSSATPTDNSTFKINVTDNTAAFGLGLSATDKFRIRQTFDTSDDASNNGLFIDYNATGTDALTADRNAIALRVDMDSTATGGNQSQELTMYAGYFDVNDTGDANHLYGMYAQAIARKTASNDNQSTVHAYKGLARAGHTAGQVNSITGGEFIAQTDNNGGTVNELTGVKGFITNTGDAGIDVGTARAGLFKVDITNSSNDPVYTTVYGVDSEIEMDETTTINNAFVNFSRVDANAGTINSAYLYRGTYNIHSNATVTDKYGIYLDGSARNYIQGSMNLGGTANYNQGVPLAVKAVATNTAEVLTKIWDGGTFAFSIDRSSTNTDANTELYRLGLNYNNNGAANGYIGFFRGSDGTNGYLTLGTSNTERVRIDKDGNVGIGTTSPSYKLHVVGETGIADVIFSDGVSDTYISGNNNILYIRNLINDKDIRFTVKSSNSYSNVLTLKGTNKQVRFDAYGSGTFTGTATYKLAVDTDGNIIELPIGSGAVDGSGTANTVTMWSDADTLTNAPITISGNDATFTGQVTATGGLIVDTQFKYDTDSGNQPFYITRQGGTGEALSIKVMDNNVRFESIQDETADDYGGFDFRMDSGTTEPDFIIRKGTAAPLFNLRGDGNATFAGDVGLGLKKVYFNNTGESIGSSVNGDLDINSRTDLKIKANNNDTANVNLELWNGGSAIVTIGQDHNTTFAGNVYIDGDDIYLGDEETRIKTYSTYLGIFAAGGSAKDVKARSLTLTTDFNDSAPTNGLYVKGNANFGGSITGKDSGIIIDSISGPYGRIHGTSSIFLGGSSTTNVQLSAALIPDADSARSLGSSSRYWSHGYIDAITTTGDVNIGGDILVNTATSGGYIQIDYSDDSLKLADANKLKLGTGNDLQIFHDGSNSRINEVGTGNLIIQATNYQLLKDDGGEFIMQGIADAEVSLYYNGSKKFETTSTGIKINGTNSITTNSGRVQVEGAFKATGVIADVNIPCLFNSNFQDLSGTTRRFVSFNSTTINAASSPTVVNYLVMPYAGRVKKVYFKKVAGTSGTGFNITMYIYKNGANVANSGTIAWPSTHQAAWSPTSSNTFAAGDTIAIAFQKSTSGITLGHVSVGLAVELTNYDI
jgi:uncharacterized Zn-binding protein involved in type VI secretion